MYVTHREGQSVYLRGYEDPYQWSLKVTEAPEAGWVTPRCAQLSGSARTRVASLSRATSTVSGARTSSVTARPSSSSPRTAQPAVVVGGREVRRPDGTAEQDPSRPSKKPLSGIPVKRIDHLNLMASMSPAQGIVRAHLGFRTTERVVDGNVEIGAWMSSNLLGHEVACMRDMTGGNGKLHHVAFYYGTGQHLADAVEMFRDYDIQIEAGPDKHGITQGQFLYVFEPGGNRIELFGEAGYLHLDPDAETKTWQMSDIDTGLAVGGAKLPWETYFTYGTPNPLALDQHIEKFSHFGPGAPIEDPDVAAAEQAIPDDIDHSRAVSGSPA
ncbi:VOC family protein [Rhodococcus pyridinivorans]|nr:VOC family protein [Rhodococcus pyridinivorans]UGQ58762.1 VOC family protein [Rhodococcus pyridinivorans]